MTSEYELQEAIREAVSAADHVILEVSDGSVEETNWLTGEVARAFVIKSLMPFQTAMLKRSLEVREIRPGHIAGCEIGDGLHCRCQCHLPIDHPDRRKPIKS